MSRKTKSLLFIALAFPMLVSLACSISKKAPDPTATVPVPVIEQPAPVSEQTEPATGQPQQPLPELPTVPPTTDLLLLDDGMFYQKETTLVSVFKLLNTDPQYTLTNVSYDVRAYDAGGAEIETESGIINFIFPGETATVFSEIWLDEGIVIESVDVDWIIGGKEEDSQLSNPFSVEVANHFKSYSSDIITGILTNKDNVTYTDLTVVAVGYNSADDIIGGGSGYVDFVPAKDQLGFSLYAVLSETPARMEVYASVNSWSTKLEGGDWWNNIQVVDWEFISTDTGEVGGGMLLENITDQVIKDTQYNVTVFNEAGEVCEARSGYIDLLWPGKQVGFSPGSIFPPEGCIPSKVDLIVMPGEFTDYELAATPISVVSTTYKAEGFWPTVIVTLQNDLDKSIDNSSVSVLLFDDKGAIVGGGLAWPEAFEANATQEVEVFVTYNGTEAPFKVEAYPLIYTWTTFGD